MRKLMALSAIGLIVAATQPSWALLGLENVTFDGSLEVSGNAANNELDYGNDPDTLAGVPGNANGTANDKRGRTATRVRVGANMDVTEGVKGRIELIRGPRQYGTSATTVAGEEALWTVHNAYVDIADLWDHNFRLGRQFVGNPGDLVWNISPTDDDNLTNNSIDGLLVQCRKFDFVHADFFTGKATEDDTITGATTDTDQGDATGDVNLTSLDWVFPTLIPGGKINLGYLLGDDNNAQVRSDDNRLRTLRVGVNGGVNENQITYRAEFFQNMGQFQGAGVNASGATELDYKGNAIDLGAGFNASDTPVGGFSIWLNWLMASGDDNVVDDKDDSFHDFSPLGINTSDRLLGEIFGKSNVLGGGTPLGQGINTADVTGTATSGTQGPGLEVINIGASVKPKFSEKSTFKLDFYTFSFGEDSIQTSLTPGAARTKIGDDIGTEIDLSWMYDYSSNVNVELGYAMLSPDDVLTGVGTNNKDDDITKLFARTKIKWGGSN